MHALGVNFQFCMGTIFGKKKQFWQPEPPQDIIAMHYQFALPVYKLPDYSLYEVFQT